MKKLRHCQPMYTDVVHCEIEVCISEKSVRTLEAKDVLPNTNRTQAAEMAEKCRVLCLW